jgi:hypothetical protein
MNYIILLQIGKYAEIKDQRTISTHLFRMLELRLDGVTTMEIIQYMQISRNQNPSFTLGVVRIWSLFIKKKELLLWK